jgi:hypothetical protein
MRNILKLVAVLALIVIPASAKDKPVLWEGTFLGTTNVDCLTIHKNAVTVVYGAAQLFHGAPVPLPLGTIFPDKKNFSAIKVYQIQVGERTFDAIPDRKNPLALTAPGDKLTLTLTDTAMYVLIRYKDTTKRYKFLVIRTNAIVGEELKHIVPNHPLPLPQRSNDVSND